MTRHQHYPDLDMYSRSSFLSCLRKWPPLGISLVTFVGFGSLAVIGSIVSDSLGSIHDWRLPADALSAVRVVFLDKVATDSDPSFPLVRDYPSTLLLIAIAATAGIVVYQWNLFSKCVGQLMQNGVLRTRTKSIAPKANPYLPFDQLRDVEYTDERPAWSRFIIKAVVGGPSMGADPLRWLLHTTNQGLRKRCLPGTIWSNVPTVAVAIALVTALVAGEYTSEVFRVLVPHEVGSGEYDDWLTRTYENWWAGWENKAGFASYVCIALFGVYIIILQNLAGFRIILLVACLPAASTFHIDWQNRDGHFGWAPLARVYRTVMWSLAIHFGALGLVVFVLGLTGVVWVVALVVMWVVAAGAYIGVPFVVFRGVYNRGAAERIDTYFRNSPEMPSGKMERIGREDLDREWTSAVHSCHFHPLYIRPRTPGWLALSLIVPSVLALVQTAIPILGQGPPP